MQRPNAVFGLGPKSDQTSSAVNILSSSPYKLNSNSSEHLSQRLIEVLEEEKQLDSSPFIKKKIFEELFDKNEFKFKVEGELTSDDQLPSEDQEEQEKEEKIFLEQQRTSSKNSRASSQKKSGSRSGQSGSAGSGSGEEVISSINKKIS